MNDIFNKWANWFLYSTVQSGFPNNSANISVVWWQGLEFLGHLMKFALQSLQSQTICYWQNAGFDTQQRGVVHIFTIHRDKSTCFNISRRVSKIQCFVHHLYMYQSFLCLLLKVFFPFKLSCMCLCSFKNKA